MKKKWILFSTFLIIGFCMISFVIASEKVFIQKVQEKKPWAQPELIDIDELKSGYEYHYFEHKLIYGDAYKENAIYYSTSFPFFVSDIYYSNPVNFGTMREVDGYDFGYFWYYSPNEYKGQAYLYCPSSNFYQIINSDAPIIINCWFQFYDANNIAHYTQLSGMANYWKYNENNYIYIEGFGQFLKENGEEKKIEIYYDYVYNDTYGIQNPSDIYLYMHMFSDTAKEEVRVLEQWKEKIDFYINYILNIVGHPKIRIQCEEEPPYHTCTYYDSIENINSFSINNMNPNAGQEVTATINWTGWHWGDKNHWAFFLDNALIPFHTCYSFVEGDEPGSAYTMLCELVIPSTTSAGKHTLTVTGEDLVGYCNPNEGGVDAQASITINVISNIGHLEIVSQNPSEDININRNKFFTYSTGVKCVGGNCGDVTLTLDPKVAKNKENAPKTKTSKGNIISEIETSIQETELNAIKQEIKNKGAKWAADITPVSRLPKEQKKKLFEGVEKAIEPKKDAKIIKLPLNEINKISLPSYFDWRAYSGQNWITPVRDQASCGSCWDFAAIGVVESKFNINENNPNLDLDLSEQHVLSCGNAGSCSGGMPDLALDYIKNTGVVDEDCFVYLASDMPCEDICSDWQARLHKISDYAYVQTNTTEAYKQALTQYGPLVVILEAPDDFLYYSSGIYTPVWSGEFGLANHAVVLVGYNTTGGYWIIKNSWGTGWGENGYGRVLFGNLEKYNYSLVVLNTSIPKGVIPMNSGTPFYTIDDNPKRCDNLNKNEVCSQTWEVNATGQLNSTWDVFTIYSSEYNTQETPNSGKSDIIKVKITTCTNECNQGEIGCDDNDTRWYCQIQEDGCYDKIKEDCGNAEKCVEGKCQPASRNVIFRTNANQSTQNDCGAFSPSNIWVAYDLNRDGSLEGYGRWGSSTTPCAGSPLIVAPNQCQVYKEGATKMGITYGGKCRYLDNAHGTGAVLSKEPTEPYASNNQEIYG